MKHSARGVAAWLGAVVMVFAITTRPARAEDQPWATGVTDQQKSTAQKFLDEGNALFLEKKFKEALGKYEQAVGAWNHPAIRFNMVRCLIQLDRTVEASDNLEQTLKYGAAPLEAAVYDEALAYQKLLANGVGNLDVTCSQPGAKVSVDGATVIATCPGKQALRVKPGARQIVGLKDGYLTLTKEIVVVGGAHETVDVKLVPLAKAARLERRWATWKPWLVFGGGLALVGFGAVVQTIASSEMSAYDRQVSLQCVNVGCKSTDMSIDASQKDHALRDNGIAITMMSVGAAAALTGGVLLYLNRTHTVYPSAIEKVPSVGVSPNDGGASVLLYGNF